MNGKIKQMVNDGLLMYLPGFQALMLRETRIGAFVMTVLALAYVVMVDLPWYLDLLVFVMTSVSFLSGVFMGQSEALWERWYISREKDARK